MYDDGDDDSDGDEGDDEGDDDDGTEHEHVHSGLNVQLYLEGHQFIASPEERAQSSRLVFLTHLPVAPVPSSRNYMLPAEVHPFGDNGQGQCTGCGLFRHK